MRISIRTTVLAVCLSTGLIGCGPQDIPCDSGGVCTTDHLMSHGAAQMCGPDSGCDPDAPPPPKTTPTLTLGIKNFDTVSRTCFLSYRYTKADGTPVSRALIAAEVVGPGVERMFPSAISEPSGTVVEYSGGCWNSTYPDQNRATYTTTRAMSSSVTCEGYYSPLNGAPDINFPCWYN
jgi:hypothetical protein